MAGEGRTGKSSEHDNAPAAAQLTLRQRHQCEMKCRATYIDVWYGILAEIVGGVKSLAYSLEGDSKGMRVRRQASFEEASESSLSASESFVREISMCCGERAAAAREARGGKAMSIKLTWRGVAADKCRAKMASHRALVDGVLWRPGQIKRGW